MQKSRFQLDRQPWKAMISRWGCSAFTRCPVRVRPSKDCTVTVSLSVAFNSWLARFRRAVKSSSFLSPVTFMSLP